MTAETIDLEAVPRWQIVHEKHGRYYNAAGQELAGNLEQVERTFLRRYGVKPVIKNHRKPRVLGQPAVLDGSAEQSSKPPESDREG